MPDPGAEAVSHRGGGGDRGLFGSSRQYLLKRKTPLIYAPAVSLLEICLVQREAPI